MDTCYYAQMITTLILLCGWSLASGQLFTPIVVKDVTILGMQKTPDVTNVSRDGGYSVLINGNIVWLYDDTECMDSDGNQLSFVSNTAAYAYQPNEDVLAMADFGVVMLGKDKMGRKKSAILADSTVGSGGWIPFAPDELDFNKEMNGKKRVAIWPGTSPTPISTTEAFLFAPLVYVDSKPENPSKEYQARGMTLISITASSSGPIARRQSDLVIPGTEVAFGGFSALLGSVSTDVSEDTEVVERDVYLLGMTDYGLQLARVGFTDIGSYNKYTFFDPETLNFTTDPPSSKSSDPRKVYLPGTFSSGSVFYSPYFSTFIMIYFNKLADSTFYIRYLNTDSPVGSNAIWGRGGRHGKGIQSEDMEALVKYAWSPQQKLYGAPPGPGGFNYAGMAHPEYFNRQYFGQSLYPDGMRAAERQNDWYGSQLTAESNAGGDGRHVLLSWTSQLHGGLDASIYQVQLAMVEFDDIPTSTATITSAPSNSLGSTIPHSTTSHKSIDMNMAPKGSGTGNPWGSFLTSLNRTDSEILPPVEKAFIILSLMATVALFW
ncbi:hypothetical protein MMC07_002866 [Pseudocyphellaria aurata]|nr:hypothetical protein [Pseudocyphellaria aurata]